MKLVRPEFLINSSKKFKYKIKKWYCIERTVFILTTTSLPNFTPILSVMLQVPQQIVIVDIKINPSNLTFKDFLKIAPTFIQDSDKIVLTNKQIRKFDLLSQQVIDGSTTLDEAILALRSGDGLTDLVVIMLFYALIE